MKILPSSDVRLESDDVVFRQSFWPALTATVGFLLATALLLLSGSRGLLPLSLAGIGSIGLLLFGAVAAASLRRALAPPNWLIALNGRRILLNVRSYLNANFPADLPHVLELPLVEVEAAGATRLELRGQDRAGETAAEMVRFLDLRLKPAVDVSELREQLQRERELRSRGAAWRHYPVTVVDERTIRIEWRSKHARITPPIERVQQLLAASTRADEHGTERVDLGGVQRRRGGTDAARQVRALAEQGRIMEATLLAERTFGWSTTEARRFVEQIRGQL
jgi:hypothetical protein